MKILVCGDVEGHFKQLFSRVQSILSKNKDFELLLCVGSFFSSDCQEEWSKYREGVETVPLPTFILGPCSIEHGQFYGDLSRDGGELCPNVTCLGQRGVYSASSGLRVAYLSGSYQGRTYQHQDKGDNLLRPYFTDSDVSWLEGECSGEGYRGVDILLTSDWPGAVDKFTVAPDGLDLSAVGAKPLSKLAMCLKPRYHFAALHQTFYERIPYRNHKILQGKPHHVTRFLAFAQVGNPDKKKRYLYAFSVTPMSSMDEKELTQQPPTATNCPYTELVKSLRESQEEAGPNFFFDQRALDSAHRKQKRQQDGGPPAKRRPPPQPRGPCWFCLGGKEVEKHLVVSIGDHTYLALSKGGMVPEHVLVLPISHYAASTDAPPEVLEELGKFKSALRKYFNSKDQSCVIFERNYKSQHLQLQVIPVTKIPSDALRQAFIDYGRSIGVWLDTVPRETPPSETTRTLW
ncbi:CWF19-like protein 1 [Halichondria panicea]|uniref:CWF19-like protein 1 n=1 Tax=Halichondria panicea TaxID=6063 RepID=UPI00312BCA4D